MKFYTFVSIHYSDCTLKYVKFHIIDKIIIKAKEILNSINIYCSMFCILSYLHDHERKFDKKFENKIFYK